MVNFLIFILSIYLQKSIVLSMENPPPISYEIPTIEITPVPPLYVEKEYLEFQAAQNPINWWENYDSDKFQAHDFDVCNARTNIIARVIKRGDAEDLAFIKTVVSNVLREDKVSPDCFPSENNIDINSMESSVKEKLLLFLACTAAIIVVVKFFPLFITFIFPLSLEEDKIKLITTLYYIEHFQGLENINKIFRCLVTSYIFTKHNLPEIFRE